MDNRNMKAHYTGRRPRQKRPFEKMIPFVVALVLAVLFAVPLIASRVGHKDHKAEQGRQVDNQEVTGENTSPVAHKSKVEEANELVAEAEVLASSYDYDGALEKLEQAMKANPHNPSFATKKEKYEEEKGNLEEYTGEIYHVFFHQLIVDPGTTFDEKNSLEDRKMNNNVMTTLTEFNKMLESMYKKGYILVNYSQIYDVKTGDDGNKMFTKKALMLPKGRKPLIISQDDVNFYQETTLKSGGFGQRYVLDKEGRIKVLYQDASGKEDVGDYDLLPALQSFVEKHPDFSYCGARAYIGLTGYDGVFGYRIQSENRKNASYKEDVAMVKQIADEARKEGFLFACHSYGHEQEGQLTVEQVTEDIKKWKKQVGKYVGQTDVFIIPNGNWWNNYGMSMSSESVLSKLNAVADEGFHFFAGVGCDTYQATFGRFLFADRYNLDGFRLFNSKERLKIFFDADKIWDSSRPGGLGVS